MAVSTARNVADAMLVFCGEHGDYLCNLKLQKLLYYAQGWFLAFTDLPLFDDEIQAWVHGPVVPSVYHAFKKFSFRPITLDENEIDDAPQPVQALVADVWQAYGNLSAYELELMTHRETPWIRARNGIAADEPCQNPISTEDMKVYFKSLLK